MQSQINAYARLAALAAAISGSVLALLFVANLLLTFVDRQVYRQRALEAINQHVMIERSGFPFFGVRPYRYSVNDCLIPAILTTDQSSSRLQAAISPTVPRFPTITVPPAWEPNGFDAARFEPASLALKRTTPPVRECFVLLKTLSSSPPPTMIYHRYIHGYITLSAALLIALSFKAATGVLHALTLIVPVVLFVIASIGTSASARRHTYVAMALAYLLFSGVTLYGWQIDLAPAELLLTGFMGCVFLIPLADSRSTRVVILTGLFGSLCASFDFMRGLIPSGLCLLLGLLAIDRANLRRAAHAVAAFCLAVVLTFAIKLTVVALIWPSGEASDAAAVLKHHMSAGGWQMNPSATNILANYGLAVEFIQNNRLVAFVYALAKMAYFSDLLAFGVRPLGILIVIVGPLTLLFHASWRIVRPSDGLDRPTGILLFLTASVPFIWVFVMLQHSIVGPTIILRIFAWPTIILLGMAAGRRKAA